MGRRWPLGPKRHAVHPVPSPLDFELLLRDAADHSGPGTRSRLQKTINHFFIKILFSLPLPVVVLSFFTSGFPWLPWWSLWRHFSLTSKRGSLWWISLPDDLIWHRCVCKLACSHDTQHVFRTSHPFLLHQSEARKISHDRLSTNQNPRIKTRPESPVGLTVLLTVEWKQLWCKQGERKLSSLVFVTFQCLLPNTSAWKVRNVIC